jgi:hypothetical protein
LHRRGRFAAVKGPVLLSSSPASDANGSA